MAFLYSLLRGYLSWIYRILDGFRVVPVTIDLYAMYSYH